MAYIANIDTGHKSLRHAPGQRTLQMKVRDLDYGLRMHKGHSITPINVCSLETLTQTNNPKTSDPKTTALIAKQNYIGEEKRIMG